MAYDDVPRKPIEIRDGKGCGYAGHDQLIDQASQAGKFNVRSDAAAEGDGYLGMDDLDRIRRERLAKQTK